MNLVKRCLLVSNSALHHANWSYCPRTCFKTYQQHCQHWQQSVLVRHASIFGASKGSDWNKAVSEAERIVGYPTSFMSLRCLLSDELSNVALQMRKLVGTKHPLLKTARRFVYDGKHNLQTRGLLVLLMSKAAGPSAIRNEDVIESMVSGIYPSQRMLAEITEMIHTAYIVHKGVVNMATLTPSDGPTHDMKFGNKMAVLSGDFLLANASSALAELYNTYVVEMMSSAIRDLMSAEFTLMRDENGQPSLPPEGSSIKDWEQQTFLSSGSLVAKGCQAAMMLANHTEDVQDNAYQFGKQIAFIHQLREDLENIEKNDDEGICVTSAPVILHLKLHTDWQHITSLLQDSVANKRKISEILKSSGAIEETKILCQQYGKKALEYLDIFQPSEAKDALQNIVYAATRAS